MRFKQPWLDRLWLVLIAAAFLIAAPIWLVLMGERFGWRFTIGGVLAALAWRWRDRLFPTWKQL